MGWNYMPLGMANAGQLLGKIVWREKCNARLALRGYLTRILFQQVE
jgi:hypothetical protein